MKIEGYGRLQVELHVLSGCDNLCCYVVPLPGAGRGCSIWLYRHRRVACVKRSGQRTKRSKCEYLCSCRNCVQRLPLTQLRRLPATTSLPAAPHFNMQPYMDIYRPCTRC
jgi:hypothetical protein